MPHRIGRHEDIGAALLRLVRDDLAAACAALAGSGPTEAAVHRVRQRLKRVRSVLRVLRPAIGAKAERAAARLRDAARLLAGARDSDAAAASARSLNAASAGEDAGFDRVIAALDREARSNQSAVAAVERVIRLIGEAERDLPQTCEEIDGAVLLGRAIDRAFRRGRTARRRAAFSLATPELHLWRKSVKDLWHLMRLARRRLPRRSRSMMSRLERLGALLGFDHDHAVLAEKLALAPEGDPALMRQLSLIAKQRRALEAEAFALGARLYRRRPGKFRRLMRLA